MPQCCPPASRDSVNCNVLTQRNYESARRGEFEPGTSTQLHALPLISTPIGVLNPMRSIGTPGKLAIQRRSVECCPDTSARSNKRCGGVVPVTHAGARPWAAVHAARAALAGNVASFDAEQWRSPSLCASWSIEQVVAHLTAAASLGRVKWLASVIGARIDFNLHNQRRLAERLGPTPAETLARFRDAIRSTKSAPGPVAGSARW